MSVNIRDSLNPKGYRTIAGNTTPDLTFTTEGWANLPQSEKDKIPDGTTIFISDDYDSNICKTIGECEESTSVNDVAGKDTIVELNNKLTNIIDFANVDVPISSTSASYPNGYTYDNCVLVNVMAKYKGDNAWYNNLQTSTALMPVAHIGLSSNAITIEKASAITTTNWLEFRITLMKKGN